MREEHAGPVPSSRRARRSRSGRRLARRGGAGEPAGQRPGWPAAAAPRRRRAELQQLLTEPSFGISRRWPAAGRDRSGTAPRGRRGRRGGADVGARRRRPRPGLQVGPRRHRGEHEQVAERGQQMRSGEHGQPDGGQLPPPPGPVTGGQRTGGGRSRCAGSARRPRCRSGPGPTPRRGAIDHGPASAGPAPPADQPIAGGHGRDQPAGQQQHRVGIEAAHRHRRSRRSRRRRAPPCCRRCR